MTTRTTRAAAAGLTAGVLLLVAGCGSDGDEGEGRMEEAAQAARAYQEAVIAQDWQAACEARTDRMRVGQTVAECVERSEDFPERDEGTETGEVTTGEVTTGEVIEVEAAGDHPAGVGVLVSYDVTHPQGSTDTARNALRLVEGADGEWLVDQAVTLEESDGTSAEAIAAALREK